MATGEPSNISDVITSSIAPTDLAQSPWDILLVVVWSVATVAGIVGNVLLILAVAASRTLHSASSVLVVNVVLADLALSVTLPLQVSALLDAFPGEDMPPLQPVCASIAVILVACTWSRLTTFGVLSHQRLLEHLQMHSCCKGIYAPANLIAVAFLMWVFPIAVVVVPAVVVKELHLGYHVDAGLCILSGPNNDMLIFDIISILLLSLVSLGTTWNYLKIYFLERKRKKAKIYHRKKRRPNPKKDPKAFQTPESPFEEVQEATLFIAMRDQKSPFRCNICGLDKKEHTKRVLKSHDHVRSQNLARNTRLLLNTESSTGNMSNRHGMGVTPEQSTLKQVRVIDTPKSSRKGSSKRRDGSGRTVAPGSGNGPFDIASGSMEMKALQTELTGAIQHRNSSRSNPSTSSDHERDPGQGYTGDLEGDIESVETSLSYNVNQSHRKRDNHRNYQNLKMNIPMKVIRNGSLTLQTPTKASESSSKEVSISTEMQIGISRALAAISFLSLIAVAPTVFCSQLLGCSFKFLKYTSTALAISSCINPVVVAFGHPQFSEVVGHLFHRRLGFIPDPTRVVIRCLQPSRALNKNESV